MQVSTFAVGRIIHLSNCDGDITLMFFTLEVRGVCFCYERGVCARCWALARISNVTVQ